jgi:hypothetical protein
MIMVHGSLTLLRDNTTKASLPARHLLNGTVFCENGDIGTVRRVNEGYQTLFQKVLRTIRTEVGIVTLDTVLSHTGLDLATYKDRVQTKLDELRREIGGRFYRQATAVVRNSHSYQALFDGLEVFLVYY